MISKAALRAMTLMSEAEEEDNLFDAEVVCEGSLCYIGLVTISKATVNELLRLALIRDDSDHNGQLERYSLNEEGRAMLDDPSYIPKIVPLLNAARNRALCLPREE